MASVKDISGKQVLVMIGGIMFIVGIITGFLPVGGNCGSAFASPNPFADGSAGCEVFRGEAVRATWQLIIGGVLLLIWTPTMSINNSDKVATAKQVHEGPTRDDE